MIHKITERKKDHLRIICEEDVHYENVTTGFEQFTFVHNALPEIDLHEVDFSCEFLGYQLQMPLIICPIGGGESDGKELNRALAKVANQAKIALGIGSLRPALIDKSVLETYTIVRENAPNIPLIANLGAVQLAEGIDSQTLKSLLNEIGADALSIHLNPLQEALQPEGDPSFRNVSRAIEILKDTLPIPIIVKEVGFGLSSGVIRRLAKMGIKWVDVAGAGGTSWSRIEAKRITDSHQKRLAGEFFEWGIPTASALLEAVKIEGVNVIASGGITTGLQFAKAIALGATLAGGAALFVRTWYAHGTEGLTETVNLFGDTLRHVMFCTGCNNLETFRGNSEIIKRISD
ncbi:MAG TPA: type 2 isopentenyl-diphosphate Delta-isomerase [Candidatus Marinimicrobia bacterium]|nr:type 2 isopentenyl-diphosphate Delta-isomerase [Candidatus Neomarinimicrobiota bacterium]HRS51642.1 type 2 isopentenyl-diphosphate Delta-isomerase [Candidatus Neomarinimicrobiota bacterium]HRU93233.1 type 2 isopentenyl-diphosphate Delta-isomerase [Candidatus Neomarinimicrobiota bacterium]